MIYSYKKFITRKITKSLNLENLEFTELATVDDTTYVYIADDSQLPNNQPDEIAASIQVVNDANIISLIKANSPHYKLINQRVIDKIREKYSPEDEQKFTNIGVGVALGLYAFEPQEQDEMLAFKDYLVQCRQWGRDQKAAIGL